MKIYQHLSLVLSMTLLLAIGCASSEAVNAESTFESTKPSAYRDFGDPMTAQAMQPVDVADVMADPAKYDGQELLLKGTIEKVCEHSGCWLVLGSPDLNRAVFVKFTCPIEGRLVPMEATGQEAIAAGRLEVREVDEDTARHLAGEAGATAEEIEAISGPQPMLWLGAPSARVFGLSPMAATAPATGPATQPE